MSEMLGGGLKEFSYHSSKATPTLLLGDVVTFYHFGIYSNTFEYLLLLFNNLIR